MAARGTGPCSQENDLSVLLATEQDRWIDFNSRLDELELALSR
jgi:hypothetical protein